jgi:chromate transporter
MDVLMAPPKHTDGNHPGSSVDVAVAFLKLGLSSFGGPIAHIGYFRR